MSEEKKKTGIERSSGARMRAGSNVAISVLAAAAVLLMINYLSMRHWVRADWTSAGIYTLSQKTEKVVRSLDREVSMYVLWSQGDPRFSDIQEILDGYDALSPKLVVELIDPDLNPERVEVIVKRYGAKMTTDMEGNMGIQAGVIVVSGDNVKFVANDEFEDYGDMMMQDPEAGDDMSEFKAEQKLTSAILRVISDDQATVCFTQGHGEWELEGFGGRALGLVQDELKQDSYRVEAVALSGDGTGLEACSLVAVVGPQRAFREQEAGTLEEYLRGGGRVLALLDPLMEGDRFAPTGLEGLARRAGVELVDDIILEVDPRRLVSDSPLTFVVSEFTRHESVEALGLPEGTDPALAEQIGAYPVVMSTARSLRHAEGTDAVADELARTSAASWGETDVASLGSGDRVPAQDPVDSPGPAIVAMASVLKGEEPGKEGRLVVVGDSDFLSDELQVNSSLFNRDFWSSSVAWLTSREDLISIAAKNPEHVRLNLTDEDVSLVWQVVVGEALLILVIGLVVWFRRRR